MNAVEQKTLAEYNKTLEEELSVAKELLKQARQLMPSPVCRTELHWRANYSAFARKHGIE